VSTIPASQIVSVVGSVLSAGGQGLDLIGLCLTTSTRVPIGTVAEFATAADVGTYFGSGSTQKALADTYFAGFLGSTIKPASMKFAQYNSAAVAPYLRGGRVSGYTLTQLQALGTGSLTVTVDGSPHIAASINLSAASSFSNAATIIQAGFTTPPFNVTYDATAGAFLFTGTSTGVSHTFDYASDNAFAEGLKLTQATGAVTSQGADAATPGPFMDGIVAITQNWATFFTDTDPDNSGNSNKLLFCAWVSAQQSRYAFVCWDTDDSPSTQNPATSSLGYLIGPNGNNYGSVCLIGSDVNGTVSASYAAFVSGSCAAINFNQTNGRPTFAFRRQDGLAPTVTNATAALNLKENGYNWYGAYGTANDQFDWFYPGQVSGDYDWLDSLVNAIWLNNQLQLSMMVLLQNTLSIPYNTYGYALIKAAALDVIQQGLNYGAFRAGVTLSEAQKAEVNAAAGLKIDDALNQNGWYFQVKDANPQTRVGRQSPPITFWYMDGQAVQQINIASVNVQ